MDNPFGDDRFADALVERAGRLAPLARRLDAHGNGADLLQDAMERAWRSRLALRSPAALEAWLRSTLLNRARDAHRRGSLLSFTALDELGPLPETTGTDAADGLIADERRHGIREALRSLPDRELVAVVLCDAEGWPVTDAALVVDATPAAMHKRLQRGRARLRAALSSGTDACTMATSADCDRILALMAPYLDGVLEDADVGRVERHVADCRRCPPLVLVLRHLRERLNRSDSPEGIECHAPTLRAAVRRLLDERDG